VLGAIGRSIVPVFMEPEIKVAVTGNELVPPEERPDRYRIRSTNDIVVSAIAQAIGVGKLRDLGILEDHPARLRRALRGGLRGDLLIVTGGVSMGRLDYVPEILEELGVRIRAHGVAIRPGKPLLFGTYSKLGRRTAVFGLPGNPMSAMVTMVEFVAPFLRAWRGQSPPVPTPLAVRIEEAISRHARLLHFVPSTLSVDREGSLAARPLKLNGSGDFVSAAGASAFLRIPGDGIERARGTILEADPIPGASRWGEANDT
jgi:molybdopterin molybdotransferase